MKLTERRRWLFWLLAITFAGIGAYHEARADGPPTIVTTCHAIYPDGTAVYRSMADCGYVQQKDEGAKFHKLEFGAGAILGCFITLLFIWRRDESV